MTGYLLLLKLLVAKNLRQRIRALCIGCQNPHDPYEVCLQVPDRSWQEGMMRMHET